jgi:hypothetical protein
MAPLRIVLSESPVLKDALLLRRDGKSISEGIASSIVAEDLNMDGLEDIEKEAFNTVVLATSFDLASSLTEHELTVGPQAAEQLNDLIFFIRRISGRTREKILKNLRILCRIISLSENPLKESIEAIFQDSGELMEYEDLTSLEVTNTVKETGFVLLDVLDEEGGFEMNVSDGEE